MKRALLPVLLLAPITAHAQAWVPTTHSLSADFGYTFAFSGRHAFESKYKQQAIDQCSAQVDGLDSRFTPDGGLHSHIFNFGIDYTPYENLAFRVSLPLVASRYLKEQDCEGRFHIQTPGYYVDDNQLHTAVSDIKGEARYMISLFDMLALTPAVGFSYPTWDYPTLGHASVGRGLWELTLGLNAGLSFGELVEGLYIHARYIFGVSQAPETPCDLCLVRIGPEENVNPEVSVHRSYLDFEVGYFILDWLSVRVDLHWQTTHGGFAYGEQAVPQDGVDLQVVQARFFDHDALRKEMFLLVGGGVGVSPIDGLVISALYQQWITGWNTHDTSAFSLTLSYQLFSLGEEVGEYEDPFEGEYED
jgi:hypothetical protein